MKTIFLTIVIIFSFILENKGQYDPPFREKPPATIYVLFQPTDLGMGLRGDYHFNHWAGIYSSASYGQWRLYDASGLDQHVKATVGVLVPFKDWMNNHHDFNLGLNYHWVSGEIKDDLNFTHHKAFDTPWSFELGLTIKYPCFAIGLRTDILRWEPCIDLGIPIRSKKYSCDKVIMPKSNPTFYY